MIGLKWRTRFERAINPQSTLHWLLLDISHHPSCLLFQMYSNCWPYNSIMTALDLHQASDIPYSEPIETPPQFISVSNKARYPLPVSWGQAFGNDQTAESTTLLPVKATSSSDMICSDFGLFADQYTCQGSTPHWNVDLDLGRSEYNSMELVLHK